MSALFSFIQKIIVFAFFKENDILGADMRNSHFNNWIPYAFGEAIGRTIGKIIQKVIGTLGNTLGHTLFVVSIVGLVQIILACLAWQKDRFSFFPNRKYILGSLSFGFLAFVTMALGFTVFQLGGSVSVNTFFVTLSIIPGALIDRFFFGHRLNTRQWFAIGVGVIAGYAILDFPSLSEIVELPLWVLLSLVMTFTLAINQGITKIIQNVNPWVQNFWGGMITLVCALTSFLLIPPRFLFSDSLSLIMLLSSLAVISGLMVVIVWIFNLYGYRYGAVIAIKKLTVHGSFLILATLFGVLLFGETPKLSHALSVFLYFCAFLLLDEKTWVFFHQRVKKIVCNIRFR